MQNLLLHILKINTGKMRLYFNYKPYTDDMIVICLSSNQQFVDTTTTKLFTAVKADKRIT